MRDSLNHELISAYLDNEVTREEREQVESALATSAEARDLLEELRRLQVGLRAAGDWERPPDFRERFLSDPRVVQASRQRATASASIPRSAATPRSWTRIAMAAASISLVVCMVAIWAWRFWDFGIGEGPALVERPAVENGTEQVAPAPGRDRVAIDTPQRNPPNIVLVYDLAITPRGQQLGSFERAMKQVGIVFDPSVPGAKLEEKLQEDLLKSRYVGDVQFGGQAPDAEPFDVVEMVYVHAKGKQADALYFALMADPEIAARLDFGINPRETELLLDVGARTWSLAAADAPANPHSRAYRLEFRFELHTGSRGFLAQFPQASIRPELVPDDGRANSVPGFRLPLPSPVGGDRAARDEAETAQAVPQRPAAAPKQGGLTKAEKLRGEEMQEILVILRKLEGR